MGSEIWEWQSGGSELGYPWTLRPCGEGLKWSWTPVVLDSSGEGLQWCWTAVVLGSEAMW